MAYVKRVKLSDYTESSRSDDDDNIVLKNYYTNTAAILDKYGANAKDERDYLLETSYPLSNGNFFAGPPLTIKCGLSSTQKFEVVVSLTEQHNCITFGRNGWFLLVDILSESLREFFEKPLGLNLYVDGYEVELECGNLFTVTHTIFGNTKLLRVFTKFSFGFCLLEDNVRNILDLNSKLIAHRILMLDKMALNIHSADDKRKETGQVGDYKSFCDG